ncbi:unnamed protein product [Penicillium egyptiacum]|uniref:F-box domain-containing protein n=1 Tax=Penicillium egyptiacum TaxID=1303716 RepID=A0A9W4KAZ7_9EURO|nr:unnamed protein product [Penicillium egyptiacum]
MDSIPLAYLPCDCWVQILEYLPKQDLNNLSQVSHDIRASTELFLYRRIHWDWKNPPTHKILALLRTISERPELAYYIWHVSFVWWDVESERTEVFLPKGGMAGWAKMMLRFRPTLRWARKVVREAQYPKLDAKWLPGLSDGDPYVYATLLVSQLHNLRSLRLDFSFVLEGGFPGEMLHHSLFGNAPPGAISRFSKLEMADYGSNLPLTEFRDAVRFGASCQFVPWFHLPSLRTLEIWLHNMEGICFFPAQTPRGFLNLPNLRSLVIAKTRAPPEDIATLLSQLPYLESLHVGMAYKCRETAEFLREPKCLIRALETCGQSIKHLSLGVEILPCCRETFRLLAMDEGGKPFRGILKRFPKLKTASLPLYFLIGWDTEPYELRDVLPSTLEALHISSDLWQPSEWTGFEMEALKALESLMRHKQKGSHPSLETFSYHGMHTVHTPERNALGLHDQFNYIYLIKREAMNLFCRRKGYKLFTRYSDCANGFMSKSATWIDNVVYWLPWPFVRVDELPASMPRYSIATTAKSLHEELTGPNEWVQIQFM